MRAFGAIARERDKKGKEMKGPQLRLRFAAFLARSLPLFYSIRSQFGRFRNSAEKMQLFTLFSS